MVSHNDLILYQYAGSPYALRVIWYLALRGIDYAKVAVAPYPPRPALDAIGVQYRRIPVLAHGRDVFVDTRLILNHLDRAFPGSAAHPSLEPSSAQDRAYTTLLEKWTIEAGVFGAAASVLPSSLPMVKDPKFKADRETLFRNSWSDEARARVRVDGETHLRQAFDVLEEQILGDGRDWVLGGRGPSRADLDVAWPFVWLVNMPVQIFKPDLVSESLYPKTFAYVRRFNDATKTAMARAPKAPKLDDETATRQVLDGKAYSEPSLSVDGSDPTGLKHGQMARAFPTDYGSAKKDQGKVVGLSRTELVLETQAPGGKTVLVHYPRVGFHIDALDSAKL